MEGSEELAASIAAEMVMNGNFPERKAVFLNLLHHLHANNPGIAFQRNLIENPSSDKAEVAVYVPQLDAEDEAREGVI